MGVGVFHVTEDQEFAQWESPGGPGSKGKCVSTKDGEALWEECPI